MTHYSLNAQIKKNNMTTKNIKVKATVIKNINKSIIKLK